LDQKWRKFKSVDLEAKLKKKIYQRVGNEQLCQVLLLCQEDRGHWE
jgi:hypothetical protein